jgi:hypothetical protein
MAKAKYKLPEQVFKLVFPHYDGLEVRITSPAIGEIMAITKLVRLKNIDASQLSEADVDELNTPQRIFVKHLIEWNLTIDEKQEDGSIVEVDVPPTMAGVGSLPSSFFQELIKAWIENTMEVPTDSPLGKSSLGGVTYPEQPIPMDLSSLRLPN